MHPEFLVQFRILYNNAVASCKLHLKALKPSPYLATKSVVRPSGDWILDLSFDYALISSADAETNPPHMQFISSLNPNRTPLEAEFFKQPDIKCHALV